MKSYQRLASLTKIEQSYARSSEKQDDFAFAFENRTHNVFAAIGGNRSGKSIVAGWMCFARYLRDVAVSGDIFWCVAPTIDKSIAGQQKELWDCLPKWMFGKQSYDAKSGFGRTNSNIILKIAGGHEIVVRFKTAAQYDSDPASFEQEKVRGVWIDETVPEGLYKRMVPARVLDLDGFVLISTIPDASWMFQTLFDSAPEAKILAVKFCMMDNESNLPANALKRARAEMTPEDQRMRIHGDFRFLEGLVYKEFARELAPEGHLCSPFPIPLSWPKFRVLDWGNAHPTCCLWYTVSPNGTIFVYREYYKAQLSVAMHTENIQKMSGDETYSRLTLIDPTCFKIDQSNMSSIASVFQSYGLVCRPGIRTGVKHGEWSLIQKVKKKMLERTALGPRLQVFETCVNLIREFGSWGYRMNRDGKPMDSDMFKDSNNDALDCIKMAIAEDPGYETQKVEVVNTLEFAA